MLEYWLCLPTFIHLWHYILEKLYVIVYVRDIHCVVKYMIVILVVPGPDIIPSTSKLTLWFTIYVLRYFIITNCNSTLASNLIIGSGAPNLDVIMCSVIHALIVYSCSTSRASSSIISLCSYKSSISWNWSTSSSTIISIFCSSSYSSPINSTMLSLACPPS